MWNSTSGNRVGEAGGTKRGAAGGRWRGQAQPRLHGDSACRCYRMPPGRANWRQSLSPPRAAAAASHVPLTSSAPAPAHLHQRVPQEVALLLDDLHLGALGLVRGRGTAGGCHAGDREAPARGARGLAWLAGRQAAGAAQEAAGGLHAEGVSGGVGRPAAQPLYSASTTGSLRAEGGIGFPTPLWACDSKVAQLETREQCMRRPVPLGGRRR